MQEIIYYDLFHKITFRAKTGKKAAEGKKSTPRSSLQLVGSAPTGPGIPDPGDLTASTSSVSFALYWPYSFYFYPQGDGRYDISCRPLG